MKFTEQFSALIDRVESYRKTEDFKLACKKICKPSDIIKWEFCNEVSWLNKKLNIDFIYDDEDYGSVSVDIERIEKALEDEIDKVM